MVHKLNETINNNDLPILGGFIVHVSAPNDAAGETRELTYRSGIAGKVIVADGSNKIALNSGGSPSYTNEITIPANSTGRTIVFAAGEYDIIICNKEDIRSFNFFHNVSLGGKVQFSLDLNELIYAPYLYEISIFGITLTKRFDITKLLGKSTLKTFQLGAGASAQLVNPEYVYGSIEHFSDYTAMTTLRLNGCINVTGSRSTLPQSITSLDLNGTSCTE